MYIQVNSNSSIDVTESLAQQVREVVDPILSRFRDRLTGIEVHLSDVNADRGGSDDKRCQIEVRPAGLDPMSSTDHAGDLLAACKGAAEKMRRKLDTAFGKAGAR